MPNFLENFCLNYKTLPALKGLTVNHKLIVVTNSSRICCNF